MANPILTSRRTFLKTAGTLALPTIVPSSVFGANAPSNRITLASVGVGQMGSGNLQGFLHSAEAQVVAVCDADAGRMAKAKDAVERHYSGRLGKDYKGCAGCVRSRGDSTRRSTSMQRCAIAWTWTGLRSFRPICDSA